MNNIRRKEIREIMEQLYEAEAKLVDAYDWIIQVNEQEEEYRDNIPENLLGSVRYEASEEASYNMECAYDMLDGLSESIMGAINYLEEAVA